MNELFPGIKVKIVAGRYKGLKGKISRQKSEYDNMVWVEIEGKVKGEAILIGKSTLEEA